ncbi:sortilin-like [Eleutherodactylus coqui]|uniref:sortilin-like n=1 Tax=Eleutherodactylus coqui TaxID=57060 RepID=UPI00346384DF
MAPRELWRPVDERVAEGFGSAGRYAGSLLLHGARTAREQAGGDGAEQQIRVHPGILAAVVVVALLALLAAIFIIKKYCFPESNLTYRYSTLRSHHEELDNSATTRLQEDSDEDLLE